MRPALILGTAQFDPAYGIVRSQSIGTDACEFLREALQLGYVALDTAPSYVRAQETIGRCGWPGQIHSKISPGEQPLSSLASTLANLARGTVDVAYFHDDRILEKEKSFFEKTAQEIVPRLAKRIGVSVYSPADFERALEIDAIGAIQVPMSAVDQRITDYHLAKAKETGKLVFARSIFLQGALAQSAEQLPSQLDDLKRVKQAISSLSEQYSRSVIEILIGAVRDRGNISGLVVGAESRSQLREIASAFASPALPEGLFEELQELRIDEPNIIDPRTWSRRP